MPCLYIYSEFVSHFITNGTDFYSKSININQCIEQFKLNSIHLHCTEMEDGFLEDEMVISVGMTENRCCCKWVN